MAKGGAENHGLAIQPKGMPTYGDNPKAGKGQRDRMTETTRQKDSFQYRDDAYPGGLGSKKVDTEEF